MQETRLTALIERNAPSNEVTEPAWVIESLTLGLLMEGTSKQHFFQLQGTNGDR